MIKNIRNNGILIIDFGSQYTQLIAKCIRKINVYCEILSCCTNEKIIKDFHPRGIILSGGPESTTNKNSVDVSDFIFTSGIPVLGICYGMQLMTVKLGGCVKKAKRCEFGRTRVHITTDNILTRGIENQSSNNEKVLDVWMSHRDTITSLPPGFTGLASTENCQHAIIEHKQKNLYGVQFHPEVSHTIQGVNILKSFLFNICNCEKKLWIPEKIVSDSIASIQKQVGKEKVILGLSGGIDSLVTAILLELAIGKNLFCLFINNGLLRLEEVNQVIALCKREFAFQIRYISAEKRFLKSLEGIEDPELKRKTIGNLFVKIFEEEATKLKNVKWLAQGTIYPDVIESSVSISEKASLIKSHHNVGGLPKKMNLKVIEPLRYLFKDEVRSIGYELGMSYDSLNRHPFPGPGLAVRIMGEVKKEYCDMLRHADHIFIDELHKNHLYKKVSQAFVIFIPVRSVSVMGDKRKYEWVVSLRAVNTDNFMTASWSKLPYEFLEKVSSRIINEVKHISRVVYDISSKPPATIEWE